MLPAILMGLGAGANVLGSVLNRPVRPTLDVEGILARMGEREGRYVNNVLGRQMSNTGQYLAANGIRGGAAGQVMGQIEAPIRAESLGRMQDAEARLREQQANLSDAYKQQKNAWLSGILSNLGGGAAAIGTGLQQQGTVKALAGIDAERQKKLMEELSRLLGSGQDPRMYLQSLFGPQSNQTGGLNPNGLVGLDLEMLNPRIPR